MRKIILATTFVLASSFAAFAGQGSFSAQLGGDSNVTVGGFQTSEQCLAYVAGIGGTCSGNDVHWTNAQARYVLPIVVKPQLVIADNYNSNRP